MNSEIICDTIEQMAEIVAALVKQGIGFSAEPDRRKADGWKIILTGAY